MYIKQTHLFDKVSDKMVKKKQNAMAGQMNVTELCPV